MAEYQTVESLTIKSFLSREEIPVIKTLVQSIEEPRWRRRDYLEPGRAINGSTCSYDFCGQAQMSRDCRNILKEYAPKFENYVLAEIAINRYRIGDYIGTHKDRDYYRRNLVIALQELGDGLLIEDTNEFIQDVEGQGVLIEGVGPAHSVPPVKHQRYCLVYLYE